MLQIEVAKEVRQGAAATESFRNEFVGIQYDQQIKSVIEAGKTSSKLLKNF